MIIYIVVKEAGGYSDYSKEIVTGFRDKEKAKEYCRAKLESMARVARAKNLLYQKQNEWASENPRPNLSDFPKPLRKNRNSSSDEYVAAMKQMKQWNDLCNSFIASIVDTIDELIPEEKAAMKKDMYVYETDCDYSVAEVVLED